MPHESNNNNNNRKRRQPYVQCSMRHSQRQDGLDALHFANDGLRPGHPLGIGGIAKSPGSFAILTNDAIDFLVNLSLEKKNKRKVTQKSNWLAIVFSDESHHNETNSARPDPFVFLAVGDNDQTSRSTTRGLRSCVIQSKRKGPLRMQISIQSFPIRKMKKAQEEHQTAVR